MFWHLPGKQASAHFQPCSEAAKWAQQSNFLLLVFHGGLIEGKEVLMHGFHFFFIDFNINQLIAIDYIE